MKKMIALVAVLLMFLAVSIPFGSSYPDGLEKVAKTLGVAESEPVWKGLLSLYSFGAPSNPYVSTLITGIFGTLLVIVFSLVLGLIIAKRSGSVKTANQQQNQKGT